MPAPTDMEIFAAYIAAVTSAIGVSGGMKLLASKLGPATTVGRVVGMYAPFCGVVLAGCTNLLCMVHLALPPVAFARSSRVWGE